MESDGSFPLREGMLADYQDRPAGLIEARNRHLGNLFLAERAVFYLQILYRLLLFRREHELEPLHEDIYDAVRKAQEVFTVDLVYSPDLFRQDMGQLVEWRLVEERMEMERLRGYKDTRKRKFRYSLAEDSRALLEWLEDRALADLEEGEEDTRDILEEVCGVLKQLTRLLSKHGTKNARDDDPRRTLYQLSRLDELTQQANGHLTSFNARLLGFAIRGYDLAEARNILNELEDFVNRFLRRVHELRGEIVDGFEQLLQSRNQEKLLQCAEKMEAERRQTPQLLRRSRDFQSQLNVPFTLQRFYADGGKLDQVCHRINDSAMRVWRKLHAHLRELERRNNRVEDIRDRIAEIARLPEACVPHDFMRGLLASAGMVSDPNYWDDFVQATPPQPRQETHATRSRQAQPLRRKRQGDGPAVSIDEQRLRELRNWLRIKLGCIDGVGTPVSQGAYEDDDDAPRIMELAKAGLLGNGRRLSQVDLRLIAQPDKAVEVQFDEARLRFYEMLLQHHKNG